MLEHRLAAAVLATFSRRIDGSALQRTVLPNGKASAPVPDPAEEVDGAEVTVGDPQIPQLDAGQHLGQQRPLGRMSVLGEKHVAHQPAPLFPDDQRTAGERGVPRRAQFFDAVLRRGEEIAVQNFHIQLRHPGARRNLQQFQHARRLAIRVPHQGLGDLRFDRLELVVQRLIGNRQPVLAGPIRREHCWLDLQHHLGHHLQHGRKQQVPFVLPLRMIAKQCVDRAGREHPFQRRSYHHAKWPLLRKRLKDRFQQHPCRLQE